MASVRTLHNIGHGENVLVDLQKLLSGLAVDSTEETIRKNLSLMQTIGEPGNILSAFRGIVDDQSALAVVAGRSYRHVNHFDKIVLVDSENQLGYRLTLHLWNPPYTERELNDELIHDHRFSFWSTLLTGDLLSENFKCSDAGQAFRQYQYVPERRTNSNFYQFMGQVRLMRTQPQKKIAGETYYLYYETTHRVLLPRNSMTCTLVLRGPRLRNFSNVYNTTYPSQNTRMTNITFSPEQLRSRLTALMENIEANRLRKPPQPTNHEGRRPGDHE
jgi:hypothetical protein